MLHGDRLGSQVEPFADEYGTVKLRLSWGMVSLLVFVLTLLYNPFAVWRFSPQAVLYVSSMSIVGLVAGVLGQRGPKPALARWGMLLNGTVLALCFLFWVAFVFIMRR